LGRAFESRDLVGLGWVEPLVQPGATVEVSPMKALGQLLAGPRDGFEGLGKLVQRGVSGQKARPQLQGSVEALDQ